ncbi:MAG TPA: serine hydrolase domain-containing protein, partial [Clostridia bacterium]
MANKTTSDATRRMCENAKTLGFQPDRLILLDKRLAEWSKNVMTPSIAVKVLRHGQVAFEGAYGISGKDKEPDSLTADTIFPVASITKPVVATLLAIMQEEGLVDFYHPVREYLPEFTGDPDNLVRVWHLLSHSSGIIDSDIHRLFDEHVRQSLGLAFPADEEPPEAWNALFLKIREKMGLPYMEPSAAMHRNTNLVTGLSFPPTHKPQEVMAYCSFGYDMAMEIITRISGERIDEYASRKLFKPLGMNDSHFIFPREKLPRYVTR